MNANDIKLNVLSLNRLTKENIPELFSSDNTDETVVTLLMPMEKHGAGTRKNPIVLKNALKKAEAMLSEEDRESSSIMNVLNQLKEMDDESSDFWQNQQSGLAMVIHDTGQVTAFKTPCTLEEFVSVGDRPRLGRLLALAGDMKFYVLAIDLNELRLFEATEWQVNEIPIEHGPTSLEQTTSFDDPEKTLQHHPSGNSLGSDGKVDAIHHGQGGGTDDTKSKNIQRYFEMIDKNLTSHFDGLTTPLVLFGQDSMVGNYRSVNSYRHIHEDDIRFNPSNQSDDQLKERILDWVKEQVKQDRSEAIESLNENMAMENGSSNFNEVVKAAVTGRVATLYVEKGASRQGTYDPETFTVTTTEEGEDELVETAVMHTASAGGKVVYVSPGDLPADVELAAIYRF